LHPGRSPCLHTRSAILGKTMALAPQKRGQPPVYSAEMRAPRLPMTAT
jgi:hypothetical protein